MTSYLSQLPLLFET